MNLLIDNVVQSEAKRLVEKYHSSPDQKDGDEAIRVAGALKNLSKLFIDGGDVQIPKITQQIFDEAESVENGDLDFEQASLKLEDSQKEIIKLALMTAKKEEIDS